MFELEKTLSQDLQKDKQWSGKLDTKWKGPFIIKERLSKKSYILNNQFGQQVKEPIYSDRLKLYKDKTL
ncbi:6027_t:CDS:2 [Dentiscutata erythropus]|uniref:6027_t:CDS:1 n=1 Tax=Dentiscutata erythropus TaxID=1348616 RepID=A0A9N9I577_9GLOM|nr:6027_t:CDS:2 [Dentiscutata erythropus]